MSGQSRNAWFVYLMLIVVFVLPFRGRHNATFCQETQSDIPAMTFLNRAPDSLAYDTFSRSRRLISRDSARIISPVHKSILNDDSVIYTIEPLCPVTGVVLYVSYYPSETDTLAYCSHPPYRTVWHTASLPDQDQLHCQFGYILYHAGGDTIISPPLPHHWIIDRITRTSRRRYVCKQAPPEKEFAIDGILDEWKRIRRHHFPDGGGFRCVWTPADFFLAVEVYEPIVSPQDRIEVCFDVTRSRTRFFGINHRIISFGPRSRSFCWAVDVTDTGTTQVDSMIIRFDEEMTWRSRLTDFGYIIEARIPFCILSDLEFPPKRIGFDIAVIDKNDRTQKEPAVYVWSGTEPAGRHNPAEWGTLVLRQIFLPLKVLLGISLVLVSMLITAMVFLILYRKRKDYYYETRANKELSPRLREIISIIENNSARTDLSTERVAGLAGSSPAEIETLFRQELSTSCEKHIVYLRIKKAKKLLLETEMRIEEIAKETGFIAAEPFVGEFTAQAGVPPEKWRENRRADLMDEDDEEEGESETSLP